MGEARRRRQAAQAAGAPWPPADEPPPRPERCATCAFTAGTEANLQPLTLRKAELCARVLHPFYCHHNANEDGTLPEDGRQLCQGWVDAMDRLQARGHYASQTEEERAGLIGQLRGLIAAEDAYLMRLITDEEAAGIARTMPSPREVAEILGRRW